MCPAQDPLTPSMIELVSLPPPPLLGEIVVLLFQPEDVYSPEIVEGQVIIHNVENAIVFKS